MDSSSNLTSGSLYDQEVINLSTTIETEIFVPDADTKNELHKARQLNDESDKRPPQNGATQESGIKTGSSRSSFVPKTSEPMAKNTNKEETTP